MKTSLSPAGDIFRGCRPFSAENCPPDSFPGAPNPLSGEIGILRANAAAPYFSMVPVFLRLALTSPERGGGPPQRWRGSTTKPPAAGADGLFSGKISGCRALPPPHPRSAHPRAAGRRRRCGGPPGSPHGTAGSASADARRRRGRSPRRSRGPWRRR